MGEPEFRQPAHGCDCELRIGGALATAARSKWDGSTPDPTVWNELSVLPGNRLVLGAGRFQEDSDSWPGAVREVVMGRLLAGEPLEEALQGARARIPGWEAAVYAVSDPMLGTVETTAFGPGASILRLERDGRVMDCTPLADIAHGSITVNAAEGEAVVAIACDPSWSKMIGPTLEQMRKVDFATVDDEHLPGALCDRLCRMMSPAAAAVLRIGGDVITPLAPSTRPSRGWGTSDMSVRWRFPVGDDQGVPVLTALTPAMLASARSIPR